MSVWDNPAHAGGPPDVRGRLRALPEDFQVDEDLGFAPDGEGPHRLLRVRKRGANTEWVARRIAEHAGLHPRDVGYAGLKDRDAVTTQWFSVLLERRAEPDWSAIGGDEFSVLESVAHRQKLRRGALAGNRFRLRVTSLAGAPAALGGRMERIAREGVPNYFGPQRFGRGGDNLRHAAALFCGAERVRDRHRRGLYLSAARSLLFNAVLDARVRDGSWNRLLPGEAVQLDGTQSFFQMQQADDALDARLARWDVHPSGPLWGRGPTPARDRAAEVEIEAVESVEGRETWREWLAAEGLRHERRPLRLRVAELEWNLDGDALELRFWLPAGAYATTVVREVVDAGPGVDAAPAGGEG